MSAKRKGSVRTSVVTSEPPEITDEWIAGADLYRGESWFAGAPEVAASTQTAVAAIAAGSDRQLEGDGPWLADANGRGTGEVDSQVTSIVWLTACCGIDESSLRKSRRTMTH